MINIAKAFHALNEAMKNCEAIDGVTDSLQAVRDQMDEAFDAVGTKNNNVLADYVHRAGSNHKRDAPIVRVITPPRGSALQLDGDDEAVTTKQAQ